jgi:predicted Ser/Thr protein kinase
MIAPGTILQNRYLVERQIGEGGMGAVYVATDQRFGSTVALKETFFDDPALRRAFEREARLLNRLRHPALPRVSDHFNEAEGQFLVMEYIPGEDLSDMLKRRAAPFPARDVLAWADQLLDALDYLHTQEHAVIHRDIKPQNLKLLPRNQIVLLDFGLAKGTPLQTRVTATGSVFGYSFNYAPIEQMQGAGTDPRSDLYSLGATLYHLLAGATPPDALARATAVLGGEPDPLRPAHEINTRVPAEVSAVLARALSLSAAARYKTAEEMRAALREAARHLKAEEDEATVVGGVSAASEQATRLMGADGAGATRPARAGETGVAGVPEAATVLDPAAHAHTGVSESRGEQSEERGATNVAGGGATAAGAGATAAGARGGAPHGTHAAAPGRADASVVTRVSPARAADVPARNSSRRALAFGAGVVALALVGVGLYSFARRGADTTTPTPAAPQVLNTPAPATPTPAPEQSAAPEPTPAADAAATDAPAPRRTPAAAAERNAPRRPAAPEVPRQPDAPAEAEVELAHPEGADRPLTPPEIREALRRARAARRQAMRERQRILEEQRRRRGPYAPPPPTPNPPRP